MVRTKVVTVMRCRCIKHCWALYFALGSIH